MSKDPFQNRIPFFIKGKISSILQLLQVLPSLFCLQYPQDPPALFSLASFASLGTESVFPGKPGCFCRKPFLKGVRFRGRSSHPDLWAFLGFHPHCHVLCTDGCFYSKGVSRVAPPFDPKDLRAIFEHRVLRMLLSRGKITRDLMALIRSDSFTILEVDFQFEDIFFGWGSVGFGEN